MALEKPCDGRPAKNTPLFFECSPYICPEPVLVKRSFEMKTAIRKKGFSPTEKNRMVGKLFASCFSAVRLATAAIENSMLDWQTHRKLFHCELHCSCVCFSQACLGKRSFFFTSQKTRQKSKLKQTWPPHRKTSPKRTSVQTVLFWSFHYVCPEPVWVK